MPTLLKLFAILSLLSAPSSTFPPRFQIASATEDQPSAEQTADFLNTVLANAHGIIDGAYVALAGSKFKQDGSVNLVLVSLPNHRIYNTTFKMNEVNVDKGTIHCHTGSCLHTEITYPIDGHVINKDLIELELWPKNNWDRSPFFKALNHFSELFPPAEGLFE